MHPKRQFVARYRDAYASNRYFATTRARVAYLLLAARSRGDTIHRRRARYGSDYQIGELILIERLACHESYITPSE